MTEEPLSLGGGYRYANVPPQFYGILRWRLVIKHPHVHRAVTHLLAPNRDEDISLFGARLRINRRREFGYYRAFRLVRQSPVLAWENANLLSLAFVTGPDDTFVDVGANVGLYAAQIARFQMFCPRLEIWAFEANEDTCRRLNVTLSKAKAEVRHIALSDQEEQIDFVDGAVSFVFGAKGTRCLVSNERAGRACSRAPT